MVVSMGSYRQSPHLGLMTHTASCIRGWSGSALFVGKAIAGFHWGSSQVLSTPINKDPVNYASGFLPSYDQNKLGEETPYVMVDGVKMSMKEFRKLKQEDSNFRRKAQLVGYTFVDKEGTGTATRVAGRSGRAYTEFERTSHALEVLAARDPRVREAIRDFEPRENYIPSFQEREAELEQTVARLQAQGLWVPGYGVRGDSRGAECKVQPCKHAMLINKKLQWTSRDERVRVIGEHLKETIGNDSGSLALASALLVDIETAFAQQEAQKLAPPVTSVQQLESVRLKAIRIAESMKAQAENELRKRKAAEEMEARAVLKKEAQRERNLKLAEMQAKRDAELAAYVALLDAEIESEFGDPAEKQKRADEVEAERLLRDVAMVTAPAFKPAEAAAVQTGPEAVPVSLNVTVPVGNRDLTTQSSDTSMRAVDMSGKTASQSGTESSQMKACPGESVALPKCGSPETQKENLQQRGSEPSSSMKPCVNGNSLPEVPVLSIPPGSSKQPGTSEPILGKTAKRKTKAARLALLIAENSELRLKLSSRDCPVPSNLTLPLPGALTLPEGSAPPTMK